MTAPTLNTWQTVEQEVRRRIHARDWKPGDLIPNEADLAAEFGCARATVNRALRTLAEAGLLDRRRKAGTRVALQPVAKATLDIPVIRAEIEARGQVYGYGLLGRAEGPAPAAIAARMRAGGALLHLRALHLADGAPYVVEDRWINLAVVPQARTAPFDNVSGNEWLLTHAPYTHGDIAFGAEDATEADARALNAPTGASVFVIERVTWDHARAVTSVRLVFAPGYRMHTVL